MESAEETSGRKTESESCWSVGGNEALGMDGIDGGRMLGEKRV